MMVNNNNNNKKQQLELKFSRIASIDNCTYG